MEGTNYYCDDDNPPFSNLLLLLLNEDCLIQILLWLPVISLLRFKSVCKSWRAIIQNPFFTHIHATTTTTTNKQQQQHVFLRYSYPLRTGDIFSVSGPEFEVLENLGIPGPEFEEEVVVLMEDSGRPNSSRNNNKKKKKNSSRRRRYQNISMAGCCNGIICLHSRCCGETWLHRKVDNPKCCTISLWNPAIKQQQQQYRFLPIPFPLQDKNHDGENLYHFIERGLALEGKTYNEEDVNDYIDRGIDFSAHSVEHFVGFGFDVKTKDYKVLLITYDLYEERQYFYARGVQVYSLSSDSWKCIDASHAQPNLTICDGDDWHQGHCLNGNYLFIRGYLYEGATNSRQQGRQEECFNPVIMSFDFANEIFRTIQLPFDFKLLETDKYRKSADIILFGEKIAVTNVCEELYSDTACLDIWVLNENIDGSESWSKFYTFVSDARPKFIKDNGEFIFLYDKSVPKLQLLNVVTQEIKDLKYDCEGPSDSDGMGIRITGVGVYKPSLLTIARNGASNR